MPCSNHAVLLKATAQHVRRETACGLPARVQLLPATARISTKVVIRSVPIPDTGGQCETKECMSWKRKRAVAARYKKDDLLNCWSSSSDISGYHAVSHEGHSTIGAWQGDGTARVKLTARHAMCESVFRNLVTCMKLSHAGRKIYFIQKLLNDTALSCTEILQKMYELNGVRAPAGYLVIELYQKI